MNRHSLTPLLTALLLGVAASTATAQGPVPSFPRTISFQGVLGDANGNPVADGPRMMRLAIYADSTGGSALFAESQMVPVVRGVFNTIIGSTDIAGIPATLGFDRPYYLGVTVESGIELAPRTQFTSVPYALNAMSAYRAQTSGFADTANFTMRADSANYVTGGFVRSLNGQQGEVEILGSGSTTVTRSGNQLIIRSSDTAGGGLRRIDNYDGSLVVDPPTGPYTTVMIREQGVQTHHLRDLSITTEKMNDASITAAKLAPGAVGAGALAPNSVASINIIDGQVMTSDVGDFQITNMKLADGSVSLQKIDPAGAVAGQMVQFDGVNVVWANSGASGAAGGDLTGTYPNPTIANDAVNSAKIMDGEVWTADVADGAITDAKVAAGIDYAKLINTPTSMPPSGAAGGDLTGTYPDPTIANDAVNSAKIMDGEVWTADVADGAITDAKVAAGIDYAKLINTPASMPPSGAAGGDLTGMYPNPTIANDAVTTAAILDGSVTNSKIANTSITLPKIDPAGANPNEVIRWDGTNVIWGANTFSGAASGDLTGNYPNPTIANDAVTTVKMLDGSVTTAKIADSAISGVKIVSNTIETVHMQDGSVTDAKVAMGIDYAKLINTPASMPPSGAAGGDLSGTYPNPTIANNAVTNAHILDGSVTDSKVAMGIDYAKLINTPATLPPSGAAGGDLSGTYPNPTIANDAVTNAHILDGSVTDSKVAMGIDYAKLINTPASLPPSGAAGGELSGTYPNPTVANNVITTAHIVDGSITDSKVAMGIDYAKLINTPAGLPPTGAAGGDLSGTYPNPTIANNAVTNAHIADGSVTSTKLANDAVTTVAILDGSVTDAKVAMGIDYAKLINTPAGLPPTGAAGGELSGTYPNPTVANNVITTAHIVDGSITDSKVAMGIDYAKLINTPAGLPPTGAAGGDLSGTYPNPTIANNAVTTVAILDGSVTSTKLANDAVTTVAILDGSVTDAKVAMGIDYAKLINTPAGLPPTGAAGGDLSGTYPNPTIANNAVTNAHIVDGSVTSTKLANDAVTTVAILDGSVTDAKVAMGIDYAKLINTPAGLPPTGAAGGDLSGTYPNPTIANNAVTTVAILDGSVTSTKLANDAVTTVAILDGSVTDAKVAMGIDYAKLINTPAGLPPTGAAGGELSGTYPNPTVANNVISTGHIIDGSITDAKVAMGIDYAKLINTPAGLPPTGAAGGDLSGTYPNPTIANNAVTTVAILDGSVTSTKLANDAVTTVAILDGSVTDAKVAMGIDYAKLINTPAGLPPTGAAGGELSGTYPNPTVANNVISTGHIIDGSITDAKVAMGIDYAKLINTPAGLPPTGAAGGDLSGTYPNPTIANNAVTTVAILDGSITDAKVANGIDYAKLINTPASLPPSGAAGGDLTGMYPAPTIANDAVTTVKILDASVTDTKLAANSVITAKIADANVTNAKLADSSVNGVKIISNAVETVHMIDGAVTTGKIFDGTITNADVSATAAIAYTKLALNNKIEGTDIVNGAITTPRLADSVVNGAKLLGGAVETPHIENGAVTLPKINTTGASINQSIVFDGTDLVWASGLHSYDDATFSPVTPGTVALPVGYSMVVIQDGAATAGFNVTLSNGTVNGETITVFNNDPNTATVTSGNVLNGATTINTGSAVTYTWVLGSGWVGK